ncbi:MAG: HAD-IB family phosphatase [Chitinophagaceae bacterium]|nr:HAD-IB family phosphatase [Chitinophagaceae bacterium]
MAKAIVRKASMRQTNYVSLEELGTVNMITGQMENVLKEELQSLRKMFVFDMDNTLLRGRFIDTLAMKYQFQAELEKLREMEQEPAVRTKRIAKLVKGLSRGDILQVAPGNPLVDDAADVVALVRGQGNIVGIISDSYQVVVEMVKNKLGADFAIGNRLEYFEGKATGEVIIPSLFYNNLESKCGHSICKTNALMHIAHRYQISLNNCITVGDSENDLCMIEKAGMGVAFCTDNDLLKEKADMFISDYSFKALLPLTDAS